jgi:hypothetical protein
LQIEVACGEDDGVKGLGRGKGYIFCLQIAIECSPFSQIKVACSVLAQILKHVPNM